MTSPDLAVLAREWLREYQSPPEVEPGPAPAVAEAATGLQIVTTGNDS